MNGDLISKATRNEFREALVYFYLAEIDMIFEAAGLAARENHISRVSGQRRTLVEQYYSNLDFGSWLDTNRLLLVYGEVILRLKRDKMDENNQEHIETKIEDLIRRMEQEGFRYSDGRLEPLPSKEAPLLESMREYANALDLEGIRMQIDRLVEATESDPALAVGTAKELVETVCKTILEERDITVDIDDMGKLVRMVAKELSLLPESIPDNAKGVDVIRRMLSNFNQIAQGLVELRNLYGTGHGRSGRTGSIQPRHAKLAVGAAVTFSTFLLDTHFERASQPVASQSTNGSSN